MVFGTVWYACHIEIPRKDAMETLTEKTSKTPPPYFAFRTLTNTLERMKDKGVPNRIDRTFLVGMSGAGQTQFIAGMRSLGLIDESGNVQPELSALVEASPADRKKLLADVLRMRYPEAVKLGSTNATTGQLVEVFNEYGVQGDTARKAIAFYLQAARYSGDIPISPLFQTPRVASSGATRKKRAKQNHQRREDGDTDENESGGAAYPDLHPALAGVLSELPTRGRGWTVERRAEFMQTFETVANFTIPVISDDELDDEAEEAYERESSQE